MLLAGILLTFGTGIFVAAEFVLVNLDRNELENRRDAGDQSLTPLITALKRTSIHLSSAQLGITITTLLTGYLMEPAISSLLSDGLSALGVADEFIRPIGSVVAMIVATALSMIIGELIPKSLALALPVQLGKVVVPPQLAFSFVFGPAVSVLNGSANAIIRSFGIEPKEELSGARSAEELTSLVQRSAMEGVLEDERAVLLSRTLRFSEHTAADVLTPRGRVQAISSGDSVQKLLEIAQTTGHSRFPVTGEDIDEVLGVAHIKAAAAVPIDKRDVVPVGAIREDTVFVPETVNLDQLLLELRDSTYQVAVVLDEYGGTAGIVTLEDLVEEIVGDLVDEHDRSHLSVIEGPDRVSFDGILRLDELEDLLNISLPEGPYETVGGFIMNRLERIPAVNDAVEIEVGTLIVDRMERRRVDRVTMLPNRAYVSPDQRRAQLEAERAEREARDE